MSENGPENSIIDCEGTEVDQHRGFYFHNGETYGSVVHGFTIQNGYNYTGGGAIFCYQSSPTISNNTFTGNHAYGRGGAIGCEYSSSPSISNNTFAGNSAWGGGAIFCYVYSNPTISNNTFTENSAYFSDDYLSCGGAICCWDYSSPTVSNNTFAGNSAYSVIWLSWGGAISCWYSSSPTISNNTFTGNSAYGGAGASRGGAISCYDYCSTAISNNTFIENYADWGGAISGEYSSSPSISNNTFTGNYANYGNGGAISCWDDSSPTIENCILWGDTPDEIFAYSATVTYSDVQGGSLGEGNIDADPLFVDPQDSDCHLQSTSPCINAGDPDYIPEPGETDMDGQQRVMRRRVDMGADEVPYLHYKTPAHIQ
jgi:predicted outer membrane repeat protein